MAEHKVPKYRTREYRDRFTTTRDYQVWSEGYCATGECGGATYHGTAKASSFAEACSVVLKNSKSFDSSNLSLWGCLLFSSRGEAQRAFG